MLFGGMRFSASCMSVLIYRKPESEGSLLSLSMPVSWFAIQSMVFGSSCVCGKLIPEPGSAQLALLASDAD
jgi:hypothetical protein